MSGFSIVFSLNGLYAGSMYVTENMLFSEVASLFFQYFPMVHENETTFFYDLNPIKSDSTKKLKELGIKNMSKIEVKTNTPMSKNKSSGFDIKFLVDGVSERYMHVVENMLFCEVVYHFCKNFSKLQFFFEGE